MSDCFSGRTRPPDARDAEPVMILHREQPFVEPLVFWARDGRVGELVEAVSQNQAAIRFELAPLGPEIIDRLPVIARPAPAPIDQFAHAPLAFDAAHDRRHVSHPGSRPFSKTQP